MIFNGYDFSYPLCPLTLQTATVLHQRSAASLAMDAHAEGAPKAFTLLYDELSPRLLRYLKRLTGSTSASHDLVQQVFLNMHQARGTFLTGSRVEPWAYAIARRRAIDWARRTRNESWSGMVERALTTEDESPEATVAVLQLEDQLRTAMALVPETQREAFLLVRLEGFSVEEAANILGTTRSAVKVRAYRAGLLLRRLLAHLRMEKAPG